MRARGECSNGWICGFRGWGRWEKQALGTAENCAATQLAAPGFSIAEWMHFDLEKHFLKWGRRQDPQSHSDRAGRMVEKDEGHSL